MAAETYLDVRGRSIRVFDQGANAEGGNAAGAIPAVFLAGIGGVPTWTRFLETLSATRRVVVPSLPGFPGAEAFRHLDGFYDWVIDTIEILEALDIAQMDLIGSSVGGALAAEVAAIQGAMVNRLVLIAPFGVFDEAEPSADIWAQVPGPDSIPNLVCADPDNWKAAWKLPEDGDPIEWQILHTRAMEAAARFLFPFGDTGITNRLHRITQPTLLTRGAQDRVLPAAYNARFAAGIRGPVRQASIDDAGHLPELDQPDALARQINAFLSDQEI